MVFICTGNDKSNIALSRYTSNIDYFLLLLPIVSISKSSNLLGKSLLIIDAHFIYTFMFIYIYICIYVHTYTKLNTIHSKIEMKYTFMDSNKNKVN